MSPDLWWTREGDYQYLQVGNIHEVAWMRKANKYWEGHINLPGLPLGQMFRHFKPRSALQEEIETIVLWWFKLAGEKLP